MPALRKATACLTSLALAVALTPAAAFADDDSTSESTTETTTETTDDLYTDGTAITGGWTLEFSVSETKVTTTVTDGTGEVTSTSEESTYAATITGGTYDETASDASTELAFPETVSYALSDGSGEISCTVTSIGTAAFRSGDDYNTSSSVLTAVTFPDTMTSIGDAAFRDCANLESAPLPDGLTELGPRVFYCCSSLTSITFPAGLTFVPYWICRGCTSLETAEFADGIELEYIGYAAFRECSSLVEMDVPPLMGGDVSDRYTGNGGKQADEYRIGYYAFYGCTSLETLTLLPGAAASQYVNDSNQSVFSSVSDDFKVICYSPGFSTEERHASGGTVFGTSNIYYAVCFYETEDASDDDPYLENPDYTIVYPKGVSLDSVVNDPDSLADSAYASSGTMPTLTGDDVVWGVADGALSSSSATLGDCAQVYPVDKYDLTYCYVEVPSTVKIKNGWQDLSDVYVGTADGDVLDEDLYDLVYITSSSTGAITATTTTYTQVDADEAWSAGTYYVYATGVTGTATAGTTTGTANSSSPTGYLGVSFTVEEASPNIATSYVNTDADKALGQVLLANSNLLTDTTPAFVAVASAGNAADMLVATWLAAVAGGQAVFTNGDSTSSYVYSSINGSSSGKVYVIGGESSIGSTAYARIKSNVASFSGSVSSLPSPSTSDAQTMSTTVYKNMLSVAEDNEYTWSSTCVVAGGALDLDAMVAVQYAFAGACPVFLADSDGGISTDELEYVTSDFESAVVVGDTGAVSETAFSSLEEALGKGAVTRVGADADGVFETSLAVQQALVDDGLSTADGSTLVAVAATDDALIAAAAMRAVITGSSFAIVASSDDARELTASLTDEFGADMESIELIGDFSDVDSGLAASSEDETMTFETLLEGIWYYRDVSATTTGDTFETGGIVYALTGDETATRQTLLEDAITTASLTSVKWGEVTYTTPTAVGASFFAGCTKLASVTGSPTSVGASAFKGCTALTTVKLSSATSIGASAFSGCTSLASVTLSAATSIGASAFSGCTALSSFSAAKVTTLATSVLSGCTALKTLSIPAVKSIAASQFSGKTKLASVTLSSVTTVGANAFKGCKALKTVALPKATTIGNAAFSGCTAMTKATCAKVTKIGSKAFFGCKKLTAISTKAKTIGASAFQGCTALKTATLSSTALTAIPATLFSGCKKLTTLTIKSAKVKKVGAGAFKGTLKSLTVKVPKSKVKAYQKLFVSKGLNKKAKVR